jgi:NADPH-dependent 2,4-dienoyl-CoA reductase/sulfur reductase-like enzyme
MPNYNYLIIGGGMTADSAVNGIREIDPEGSIGILTSEPDPPYDRPPLTKALWKGQALDTIWRKTASKKVHLLPGRTATAIDLQNKSVTDDQNTVYTYGKLLLATGGSPRRLPFGGNAIIYYRTLADYRRLRELTQQGRRFAVIGGGFIGSELAAALTMNDRQAVMLFPGSAICDRVFPPELANFVNEYYRKKGVEILPGETAAGLTKRGDQLVLTTKSNKELVVDGVVAGLGITPNTDLAHRIGAEVDNGIVVDEFLRTTKADVYAAGDVARFYSPALETPLRVEHEDNANTMGKQAGRNMAGSAEPYHHLPFFYSDLFDLGYEAVGEVDSRLKTTADWKEPFREGVIYYQREGRVRGVLLWNVFGQVDAARRLIAQKRPIRGEELKGALAKA